MGGCGEDDRGPTGRPAGGGGRGAWGAGRGAVWEAVGRRVGRLVGAHRAAGGGRQRGRMGTAERPAEGYRVHAATTGEGYGGRGTWGAAKRSADGRGVCAATANGGGREELQSPEWRPAEGHGVRVGPAVVRPVEGLFSRTRGHRAACSLICVFPRTIGNTLAQACVLPYIGPTTRISRPFVMKCRGNEEN